MGGDCMVVSAAKGVDANVVGSATFKDRRTRSSVDIHEAAAGHFTLHDHGKQVGEITVQGENLQITIRDDDGVYARTMSAERGPGLFE